MGFCRLNNWCCFAMVSMATLLSGCIESKYGDLGAVSGKVTFQGEPYPNAMVTFAPTNGGRPSSGVTNAVGEYELVYIRTTRGAEPGEHKVMIATTAPQPVGDEMIAEPKEVLPAHYNVRSQLFRTVEVGPNVFDYELTTQRPFAEPGGLRRR